MVVSDTRLWLWKVPNVLCCIFWGILLKWRPHCLFMTGSDIVDQHLVTGSCLIVMKHTVIYHIWIHVIHFCIFICKLHWTLSRFLLVMINALYQISCLIFVIYFICWFCQIMLALILCMPSCLFYNYSKFWSS